MKCNIPPCEEASLENCNKLFSADPSNSCRDSASVQKYYLGRKRELLGKYMPPKQNSSRNSKD